MNQENLSKIERIIGMLENSYHELSTNLENVTLTDRDIAISKSHALAIFRALDGFAECGEVINRLANALKSCLCNSHDEPIPISVRDNVTEALKGLENTNLNLRSDFFNDDFVLMPWLDNKVKI